LAEVSARIPAIPAKKPMIQDKASGCQMKLVIGRTATSMDSFTRSRAVMAHVNRTVTAIPTMKPSTRAPRGLAWATSNDADTERNQWPELRSDHHGSNDQDWLIEQHPDTGDQHGDDHEGQLGHREPGFLACVLLQLLPNQGVRTFPGGVLFSTLGSSRQDNVKPLDHNRAVTGQAQLLKSADYAAGCLARDVEADDISFRLAGAALAHP
jgi:hypothetical protein